MIKLGWSNECSEWPIFQIVGILHCKLTLTSVGQRPTLQVWCLPISLSPPKLLPLLRGGHLACEVGGVFIQRCWMFLIHLSFSLRPLCLCTKISFGCLPVRVLTQTGGLSALSSSVAKIYLTTSPNRTKQLKIIFIGDFSFVRNNNESNIKFV
jgi:hypothetical protein